MSLRDFDPPDRSRPGAGRASLHWLWLTALIVVLDQATKTIVAKQLVLYEVVPVFPGFNIILTLNSGAAFSFLGDAGGWQRWLFSGLAIAVSAFLVRWLYTLPPGHWWMACALSLILGGAIGNLWDRLVIGAVVDFLDVYYGSWHWPAFNVADSAICVGAVMLLIVAFRGPEPRSDPRQS